MLTQSVKDQIYHECGIIASASLDKFVLNCDCQMIEMKDYNSCMQEAFADDALLVALLFERYQQLTAGLLAGLVEKPKKKRKG
jgi:hypothetical protein